FLGVDLGHTPVVEELSALHGVAEMGAPVVSGVHVAHGGGDSAFRHHRVGLAQKRFANDAYACSPSECFNGRAKPGAARADDQNIMLVGFELAVHKSRISLIAPVATRRT